MRANNTFEYDFIVTGAGAAGRSFVYQLLQSPLRHSRVLIIDRAPKTDNDRTWSYWEAGPGLFDAVVCKRWDTLWFHAQGFSRRMDIAPFSYKMVMAADYYRHTDAAIAAYPNVEWCFAPVQAITQLPDGVRVDTPKASYTARWCINSIPQGTIDKSRVNYLDQHFRGWFIRTADPIFQPDEAVMMDFRTPQQGEFRFLYVLPSSAREALVEVAIFSNNHLQPGDYDHIMMDYLHQHYPALTDFTIQRTEQGNIPMTDHPFPPHEGHTVHLGMAGGDTRASTGYTFLYIHRRVARLIDALVATGDPRAATTFSDRRHRLYDSTMLHVLAQDGYPGAELFTRLFERNPPARLLRFLNGETSIGEELAVMTTAPTGLFMRAFLREALRF
jgi:lycopene beta-cyclase